MGKEEQVAKDNLLDPEHNVSSCCQVLPVTLELGPAHRSPHDMSQPQR